MRCTDRSASVNHTGREAGYTLTEMLVVIGIIGLIAAALTPNLINQFSRAKAKTAQLQLDSLAADVEAFQSDVGRYPTQKEGLQALISQPGPLDGWTGPYLRDAKLLNDPWGNPVVYVLNPSGRSFQVESLGADGKPGGQGVDHDLAAPKTSAAPAAPSGAPS